MLLGKSSGEERAIELAASPLRDETGELVGAVILLHDVTELRGLHRQMSYQATHDALTGLVNRREFERRLDEATEAARRGEATHMLCYLDLDRFKIVNDTSGHLAGDSMLREVAKLLREAVRDSDTVARLGGDEFGMLLVGCPLDKARQIADDVCRSIATYRFVWHDRVFNIGVSIGLIEIGREAGSVEQLLAAADSACYVAKKEGAGRVSVYSARDEALARSTGEIEWLQKLQSAIKEERFALYYQPIVSAYGNDTDGPSMEVLLRMLDETGAEIAPLEFVAAAERYRLMASVDRWVVQTTLGALSRNAFQLARDRSVAINISGQTLGDPLFLEFVVECLDRTGVAPDQVCFEIDGERGHRQHGPRAAFRRRAARHGLQVHHRRFRLGRRFVLQPQEPAAGLSQARRLVHAQPGEGFGEPDHGDRDDQARAHAQFQDHRRAGGRQRRARSSPARWAWISYRDS